jgi:hypothetical protein
LGFNPLYGPAFVRECAPADKRRDELHDASNGFLRHLKKRLRRRGKLPEPFSLGCAGAAARHRIRTLLLANCSKAMDIPARHHQPKFYRGEDLKTR